MARRVAVQQVEGRLSLDAGDCRWGHTGIPWTDSGGGNGRRQWGSDMTEECRGALR